MSSSKLGRWIGFLFTVLVVVVLIFYTAKDSYIKGEPNVIETSYDEWNPELVEAFGSLPIQDGGRIKPVSTWAGFEMLAMNGKRKLRFESGKEGNRTKHKIGPTEWALDLMFRPEIAADLDMFQVEDSHVIELIGLDEEATKNKKRRDRYSFSDFEPHLGEMDRLSRELLEKKQDEEILDPIEEQFLALYTNLQSYLSIGTHFTFLSEPMDGDESKLPPEMLRFSNWVEKWEQYSQILRFLSTQNPQDSQAFEKVASRITMRVKDSVYSDLAFFPPAEATTKNWPKRQGWLQEYMMMRVPADVDQIEYIKEMEKIAWAYRENGQDGLLEAVQGYKKLVDSKMEERGEGKTLKGEIAYYKADYFYRAITPFVLGFLVVSFGWISPSTRWGRVCNRIGWCLLILGAALVVAGVTHRSILMQRPPVGNLYDTIPFITAVAILVLAFMEYITKRGVCLGLAFFLGVTGMFLALLFEESKGVDPMNPLIAVLRSNFWLATHVITITIGYAGGLLTAGLAHVFIFARIFNIDEGDKAFRRFMTRIVYGGICFTLFFSLVGTILGGVWANDSWGRFWGWDPKENGALIIVLWCLIILHARLAGYVREWGTHICAVVAAMIVIFSWFHVNYLGIGLHNYGFTGGAGLQTIYGFYVFEAVIVAIALAYAWHESSQKKAAKLEKQSQELDTPLVGG